MPVLRRAFRWSILGALVALALVFGLRPALDGNDDASASASSSAISAYRADVRPILDRGGSVVALGLKPGVADVGGKAFAPEVLTHMTDGWVTSFESIRADFAKVDAPAAAGDAHWLYQRSLDEYLHAAQALRAAVDADGAQREKLVSLAAALGESADDLYDRAETTLDRLDPRANDSRPE